jgi:hypothetical protein
MNLDSILLQNANTVCVRNPTHKQPYHIRETDSEYLVDCTTEIVVAIYRCTFFYSIKYG